MTLTTAWIQSKLRDQSNVPRYMYAADLETALLNRIHLIKSIEVAYFRGLINRRQIDLIEEWLTTGIIEDRHSLAAALVALSVVADYEDETFIKNNEGKGKTRAEIETILLRMSEEFTESLVAEEITLTED